MSKILSFFKIFSKIFSGGGNWIFGVLMIISLFSKKKKQESTTTTATSNYQSPTYSWDNIANTSEVDAPLPIVFGTHKVGGNIINTHIITKITTQNKIINKAVEPNELTYDNVNKKISCFLNTGGIEKLNLLIGVKNYGVLPEKESVNIYIEIKKHVGGNTVYSLNHLFKGEGGANAPFSAANTISNNNFTASTTVLDKTYTDGYDVTLTYLPVAKIDSQGRTTYTATKYFGAVLPLSYNKMDGVITLGSTNEYSAQTLQMDIGLSVGQIRSVKSVTINDQPVSGYTSIDKYGQNEIRIEFDWKCGHDFLIEENLNKTITGQSAVFNQNKVMSRLWAVLITQPAPLGATSITVADNSIFVKEDGSGYNDLYIGITGGVAQAVAGITGNDIVNLVNPNTVAVASAGTAWARVNSDDTIIKDTGKFTDFDYVTQFNYSDSIDLALVCPNGLYIINQETGAYLSNNITYHVYIAHDEIWDDMQPHDIKASSVHFYSKEITVTGNRRGKIWYNYQINDLPSSATGKKKYRIKVRKISRDSVDSSINMNDFNIAYVEEIKNKDLYYNGLGYATLNMPADPRLNGGNPSFAFTIDGVRVPKLLHESLRISSISDSNTVVHIANVNGSTKNAISGGTEYSLNTPFLFINGVGRIGVNEEYSDIFTHGGFTSRTGNYRFSNIVTCLFKCGTTWHKRYCYFGNTYAGGDPSNPENHLGRFVILTYANILSMIANPTIWFDGLQYSDHDKDLLKMKDYMDSDPYLKEFNTALPSQPTDMLTYTWSSNPANALLYMLIDENGLKIPIQYIDIDSFREAETYFNEPVDDLLNLGKTIPRCELNFVIDTISNVRNHIDKICTTCHSSLLESNGKIKIKTDKQGISEYFIDENTHIMPNSLKVVSLPDKDLPNQINITFLNEVKDYAKEIITIEDSSIIKQYGDLHVRKLDMDLFGVTTSSQVYREGLLLLKQAKYIQYTVAFKTSVAGFPLEVGTIFTLRSTTHGFGAINDPSDGKLFRVMGIKYDEKQECEVTAIEYYDAIYEITNEDKLSFPVVTHSELPNPSKKPSSIKNLTLTEYNEQTNSGDVITSIVGTFQTPDRPVYLNNNMTAFLGVDAASGATTIYLRTLDEAKRLNLGDKVGFNTFVSNANIATLESLTPIANMIPNSPSMQSTVAAAMADISAIYDTLTPYTIQSIDYSKGAVTITPALSQAYAADSFLTTISYTAAGKYEFSKYSHVVASLIKVNGDGTHTVIFDKEKFEGSIIKFAVAELGTYFVAVCSVSSNGMIGDPVVSSNITLLGKQLAPNMVSSATAIPFKFKHVYKINWTDVNNKDIRNYLVTITDTVSQTIILTKTVIHPLEYTHTFTVSGNYDIKIYAVNTSGIVSSAYTLNKDVAVDLTENLVFSYTLRGNLIIASWNPIETTNELIRYAVYLKAGETPFTTEHGGAFNPDTNPYLESDYQNHKVWEGTSTQIPIGNLTDGSILTYDEPYHLFVLAKYKYNGVERIRQAEQVEIQPLSESEAIIIVHSVVPNIVDGLIQQDNLKVYVAAIPDAGVSHVYGSIVKQGGASTGFEMTKNIDDLYEYDFTFLEDGKYTISMYGQKLDGSLTNSAQVQFEVDTSIPPALPRPYITKDNTYVQTQTIAFSAQVSMPVSNGETIDIYNSKTIQVCLPTFTTCTNFSHIKMYLQQYDAGTKTWSAYTEYKLPQSPLQSEQVVVNFKSIVTFAEDMPDFRIKLVQVKKSGTEGSLNATVASLRSKIDTTPPLIKINTITYESDSTNFNAVNNNYLNAKLNVGLGILLDLSITENNSGLWSNIIDEANLKMPVYYQINSGVKTALRNVSGQFTNPFLIPKAAFNGIAEGEKVTITIFALDNALKLGSTTLTKILDTTAPANPTSITAVFGVEANKGVIKLTWTNPINTDLAGIRIYEGTTLVKETTGQTASIPTPDGTTRTFVLKAYDKADNESTGVTKQAINYPPAQVTGVVATSDSGAVGLSWAAVTLDTGDPLADPPIAPEVMTDLKHYQLSYINPRTGLTITTNYTNDTHFTIEMELADVTYFNANQNKYLTDIKIRAIDFFDAEGAYSTPIPQARPRFIEAVDMKSNIFKFVPSTDMTMQAPNNNLEYIVDANYKTSEYVHFINAVQGNYVHLDMKPEYVPEVKLKFNSSIGSGAVTLRVLIKYRQIDPVTFVESDVYLQSTTNDIANISESAVLNYANYIPIALTSDSSDNANTFIITLMKTALTKKSFYIKGVDLIIASGLYSTIGLVEIQPRIRSIANDFYGETLYLSNMFAIRSSENTTTYLDMSSTALTMYNASVKSLVLGDLSTVSGSGYGLWAKDNIYLGGTTAANAHVKINTTGVYLGYYNGTYYHTEITSGAVKLCYSPTISNFQVVADKDGVIVRDYTTSANNIFISTNYIGGIGLGYKTYNYSYSFMFYNTIVKNDAIYMGFVGDYSGYNNNTQSGSYNLQITSTSILLGNVGTLWNGVTNTNYFNTKLESSLLSLGLNSINHTTQAPNYNTVIGSNYLAMGFLSDWSGYGATLTGNYNLVLDATYGLSMYRATYSSYNGNPVKVHYGFNISTGGVIGIGFYNIDTVTNATIFNTVISGSEVKMGCSYLGSNVNVYNTKITAGAIYLGHLSSGTSYAMTMDYSSATTTNRYFSIKGADTGMSEYFRVGYFVTGGYSKYACWARRLYVSNDYTADLSNFGQTAYFYMKVNDETNGIFLTNGVAIGARPLIYSYCTNGNSAIKGENTTTSGFGVEGIATGTGGIGIYGESPDWYGVHGVSNSGVSGVGVYGVSLGTGVNCGTGVVGFAYGYVNSGNYYGIGGNFYMSGDGFAALYAHTSNPAYTALYTDGKVKMVNLATSSSGGTSYPLYIDGNNKVWINTSSIKYKYDVTPFVANFERLVELQPRNFKWKSSGVADYGYIAEEVAGILPELVLWEGTDPNGVRYDRIALMLVEVAKRQKTEIDCLKESIEELKKLVDNLINK